MTQQRRVVYCDKTICYQLERKAVKNVNLRVRRDGSVYVSANKAVPAAEIDKFVASKAEFVLAGIERMKIAAQREVKQPVPFTDEQCRAVFQPMLDAMYPQLIPYGVSKPTLRTRQMKSRWGSCMVQKNIITLNRRLLAAPKGCIEYVVMHELCHLVHPNHSKEYYTFLTAMMPDWKARKTMLENSGV